MIKNTIRLLWIGKKNLDTERHASLLNKFQGDNELKVFNWPELLPSDSAVATREILETAEQYKAVVIAGEFEPHVAAQLVRSQTFGGKFSRYVIALPVQDSWEVFL